MFSYIIRKIRILLRQQKLIRTPKNKTVQQEDIPKELDKTISILDQKFSDCSNFVKREITVAGNIRLIITYIIGFVDHERIELSILKPILELSKNDTTEKNVSIRTLRKNILLTNMLTETQDFHTAINNYYSGCAILFVDNENIALCVNVQQNQKRAISQSDLENVIRGPREAFVEDADINLVLLTKYIKNPDLKSEKLVLGTRTNTAVYVCYLKGVAKKSIINKVRRRLLSIDTDAILESNFLQEYINDNPFTLFPLIGNHERPDVVAAQVIEGRIAIICGGSPLVLTMPFLFIEGIQNSEDYYNKSYFASFVRILRIIAFFITLTLPAIYVAFLNFHHEVTPINLLITSAASQENIPLSSLMEALVMLLAFELLREAGIRMPRGVGQTVSIVGALILGESAVKAGFVSNFIVIIVALTAISSFINSSYLDTVSVLRFALIVMANVFGFAGVLLTLTLIYIHMCSLTSFGAPYMSPISPLSKEGLKDAVIRAPLSSMKTRPEVIAEDAKRKGDS